jgi:hypothetical protein
MPPPLPPPSPPPAARAGFVCLYLPAPPLPVVVARDAARGEGDRVGEAVIARMAARLEAPTAAVEDGRLAWDRRHAWAVEEAEGEAAPALLLARLLAAGTALLPPPPPAPADEAQRERERASTAANFGHRVDLMLRDLVGRAARAGRVTGKAGAAAKKAAAAQAASLRPEEWAEEGRLRAWLERELDAAIERA